MIPTQGRRCLGSTCFTHARLPSCTVPEDLVQGGLWHSSCWPGSFMDLCAEGVTRDPLGPRGQVCWTGSSSWGPVWETLREARLVPGWAGVGRPGPGLCRV